MDGQAFGQFALAQACGFAQRLEALAALRGNLLAHVVEDTLAS
jgi:hypothetical protein